MSERDISKDENTPHVPEEQEELSPANDQRNVEEQTPVVESRNSDHESPPLEGAVGGDAEDGGVERLSDSDRELVIAGKQDLFERFFSDEYTQVKTRILGRRRHNAERQTVRRRHFSDGLPACPGKPSDELPACPGKPSDGLPACPNKPTSPKLWHFTEIPAVVLNQAGAVIGKTVESEPCLGSENGSALPDFSHVGEGSEHSISSIETALIEDLYAPDFPNRSSLNRRLSLGCFRTLRCQPPSDTSDNLQPPHLDDTELTEDQRTCMPARQRRFGVDESIRSRDEPESLDVTEDLPESSQELTDVPVCSIFPPRKISSDSSGDSLDLGDEAENYRPSSENDSCPPMPDINVGTVEELTQSWESLRISSGIVYDGTSAIDESPVSCESPGGAEAENKPDVVDQGQETICEQSPVLGFGPEGEAEKKPDVVSDQDDVEQETASKQSPV